MLLLQQKIHSEDNFKTLFSRYPTIIIKVSNRKRLSIQTSTVVGYDHGYSLALLPVVNTVLTSINGNRQSQ